MSETVRIEVPVPFVPGRGGKLIVACYAVTIPTQDARCFAYDERRHEHYACRLGAATYPALTDVYPSVLEPEEGGMECPIIAALKATETQP